MSASVMRPAILQRLRGVQAAGKGWLAFCPAHEDRAKRSLSVGIGEDGKTLVNCHAAGCSAEQITAAVGMTLADLAGSRNGHQSRRGGVVHYDYRDERGQLLYQVVRFEPKDFRCRRPVGQGEWAWNLGGVRLVPYRLPDLAEQSRLFIVEGEKDADRLAALSLAATCNHGGAGKWRPEHTEALVAAAVPEVVVIPDHDEPGEAHAQSVARSCAAAGLRVKFLRLAGLPAKGDVSDWLDAGHLRGELLALAEAAAAWSPDAPSTGGAGPAPAGPVMVCLADVAPEDVEWFWHDRVARGKLALIIGESGTGKTYITLDMTARMTSGVAWPDGQAAPTGSVILLTSEDGLADTVRPIVDRQGGTPRRVHVLQAVRVEGEECPFTLERDLGALEAAIQQTGAIAVVISPLSAYLGAKDSYKDSEIRGLLTPLAALAERLRVAILGIMHLTKAQTHRLLLRAQGSVAFVAQARTVLVVGETADTPGLRLLASVKNNLGPTAPTLAFRISDAGLRWEPDPIPGAPESLLAVDAQESRSERRERDQAAQFLRDLLADGPAPSKQVMADAKANGIAQRTLWRAKAELKIRCERAKEGPKSPWYWMLPAPEDDA